MRGGADLRPPAPVVAPHRLVPDRRARSGHLERDVRDAEGRRDRVEDELEGPRGRVVLAGGELVLGAGDLEGGRAGGDGGAARDLRPRGRGPGAVRREGALQGRLEEPGAVRQLCGGDPDIAAARRRGELERDVRGASTISRRG